MFNWSYTRLRDWETCPRQYEWKHIQKHREPESAELKWGNVVHHAFENRILRNQPLPENVASYEKFMTAIDAARAKGFTILGEQEWAISSEFMPCGWKEWDVAWFRAKLDAGIVSKKRAVFIDWKTGKPKDDQTQLSLFAAMGLIHYPQLDSIETKFVWTQGGDPNTATYTRDNINTVWENIIPRVMRMQTGIEKKQFVPQPSGLCRKWCSVTTCEFHGKGR